VLHRKNAEAGGLNKKLRASYRARLCANLASILARLYSYQSWKNLRDQLRKQRRLGRDLPGQNPSVLKLNKQYSLLMRKAVSLLPDDPMVREWHQLAVLMGKSFLRKARKGLEVASKRPYLSPKSAMTDLTIHELAADGLSFQEIEETLKDRGLTVISRQAIHKRLRANAPSK
jgi:hypothetical protein